MPSRKESVTHLQRNPEGQAHCVEGHEGMQQRPKELQQWRCPLEQTTPLGVFVEGDTPEFPTNIMGGRSTARSRFNPGH